MYERERLKGSEKASVMLLAACSLLIDSNLRSGLSRRASTCGAEELIDKVQHDMDDLMARIMVTVPITERDALLKNLHAAQINVSVARKVSDGSTDDGMYVALRDWETLVDYARGMHCFACSRHGAQCRACGLRKCIDRSILTDLPEIDGCPYRDGLVIVERKGGDAP